MRLNTDSTDGYAVGDWRMLVHTLGCPTIDNSRAFCYMMVGHPNAYNPYG